MIRDGVALAPFTTLELGGPARHFVEAGDDAAVVEALRWAEARALPVAILGGGSNLVVADEGFPGLVVRVGTRGRRFEAAGGEVIVTAAAGEPWDDLVAETVARDLAGLECLSGIPGLVGATPIQNVGAYGQEVAETIGADVIPYVNRLSDALFVMSRHAARLYGEPEPLWEPEKT